MKHKKAATPKKSRRKLEFTSIGDVDVQCGAPDEQGLINVTVTATNVNSPFGAGVIVSNPTDAPTAILERKLTVGAPWDLEGSKPMELLPGQTNDWFAIFGPIDPAIFRGTVRRIWDASKTEEANDTSDCRP